MENFHKNCIDAHNKHRRNHGVPDVVLDEQLSKDCQQWADYLGSKNMMQHSETNGKYGENLFYWFGAKENVPVGHEPVDSWYSEIKDYKYFGGEPDMATFTAWGHFTSVIWRSVTKVGVGFFTDGRKMIVVCRYLAVPNVPDKYNENVPARLK